MTNIKAIRRPFNNIRIRTDLSIFLPPPRKCSHEGNCDAPPPSSLKLFVSNYYSRRYTYVRLERVWIVQYVEK